MMVSKQKFKIGIIYFIASYIISVICHSPILYDYFKNNRYYMGRDDGFDQMIPFQIYIYEHFTNFNFFYNMDYGLGGDFFSGLAYYFTTSPISWLNFISVYLLDILGLVDGSSPQFWAEFNLFHSIFKLSLIFLTMYLLMRYFNMNRLSSIVASIIYGFSTYYVSFSMLFPFFSEVMIYLPLIILGLERLFKERKVGLFIIATALVLQSNFYFSFISFIFVLLYFILRLVIRHSDDVLSLKQKLTYSIPAGFIAFCLGSIGFLAGVYGFLGNERSIHQQPEYKLLHYDFTDDLLFNTMNNTPDAQMMIYFMSLVVIFCLPLYKDKRFLVFAILSMLYIVGNFSPLFGQFMNGMSFEIKRYFFVLIFATSILIGMFIHYLKDIKWPYVLVSFFPLCYFIYNALNKHEGSYYWIYFIPIIYIVIMIYKFFEYRLLYYVIGLLIIASSILMSNEFKLHFYHTEYLGSHRDLERVTSPYYQTDFQQNVIDEITEKYPNDRIKYSMKTLLNNSLYQNFNGTKLYNSIIDESITNLNKEFKINPAVDMNSFYSGVDYRPNLNSLLNINHQIQAMQGAIPLLFTLNETKIDPKSKLTYNIYNNDYPIDFVRVHQKVYSPQDMRSPLDKEQAMMDGIISDNIKFTHQFSSNKNLFDSAKIIYHNASQDANVLNILPGGGTLEIQLQDDVSQYKQMYVDFMIESIDGVKPMEINVNGSVQSRSVQKYSKPQKDVYLRISNDKVINIQLPEGKYNFKMNGIWGENFNKLQETSSMKSNHEFINNGDQMTIKLDDHKGGFVTIPIPYKDGMKAIVDGKRVNVLKGNYFMPVIKVDDNAKNIKLTYTPTYFKIGIILFLIGIICLIFCRVMIHKQLSIFRTIVFIENRVKFLFNNHSNRRNINE